LVSGREVGTKRLMLSGGTLLAALATLVIACVAQGEAAASSGDTAALGSARKDANGRFLNPSGDIPFASPLVTWPFFFRRAAAMIASRTGIPAVVANDGAFLRGNAGHSVPVVTWVGHATLLVQMDHATFLTDPIWSDRASPVSFGGPRRMVPPGIALDALPPIDFVLVSHNHYDHLDVDTLGELARRNPAARFVVPLE